MEHEKISYKHRFSWIGAYFKLYLKIWRKNDSRHWWVKESGFFTWELLFKGIYRYGMWAKNDAF